MNNNFLRTNPVTTRSSIKTYDEGYNSDTEGRILATLNNKNILDFSNCQPVNFAVPSVPVQSVNVYPEPQKIKTKFHRNFEIVSGKSDESIEIAQNFAMPKPKITRQRSVNFRKNEFATCTFKLPDLPCQDKAKVKSKSQRQKTTKHHDVNKFDPQGFTYPDKARDFNKTFNKSITIVDNIKLKDKSKKKNRFSRDANSRKSFQLFKTDGFRRKSKNSFEMIQNQLNLILGRGLD